MWHLRQYPYWEEQTSNDAMQGRRQAGENYFCSKPKLAGFPRGCTQEGGKEREIARETHRHRDRG